MREEGRSEVGGRRPEPQKSGGYRDLLAWQLGMELVREIYRLTDKFPRYELFGLISQLRRAAVSVPSNLAEGYRRTTHRDFKLFIGHSRGSLAEIETQLEIACDLAYVSQAEWATLQRKTDRLAQVLAGLSAWAEEN
jgi:four helix bundle protein